jgi:hypothetical protein
MAGCVFWLLLLRLLLLFCRSDNLNDPSLSRHGIMKSVVAESACILLTMYMSVCF